MDDRVARIAAHQHGVVTLAQLRDLGVSREQVRARLGRGQWTSPCPGVYVVAGSPRTWHQRLQIALGATGGTASHRSAAVLWRLGDVKPGRVEVTVPRTRYVRPIEARIHRSTQYDLLEAGQVDGLAVSSPRRTLVDLGAVVSRRVLEHAVDDALNRKLCTWPDIAEALVLHARRGRNGVGALRSILDHRFGQIPPQSRFNRYVARLLDGTGIPEPLFEHEVFGPDGRFIARLDLAWPDRLVGVDPDGRESHLQVEQWERDHERHNELRLAGWIVLTYTWRFYLRHPDRIVAEIRQALRW